MSDFSDLGLAPQLAAAAAAAGFDRPTSVQIAAIPVLRRGGNAALGASSGSGVTAAWALALLDRLYASSESSTEGDTTAPESGSSSISPRALVLVSSDERASDIAKALVTLSGEIAAPIRALTVEWSTRGGHGIVVASIVAAARSIRESNLKLDRLEAIVFEQVGILRTIEGEAAFQDLAAALPAEAQRIMTTPGWSKDVERFIEAHARRALTIPARTVDEERAMPPAPVGSLSYMTVAAGEKTDALARILRRARPEAARIAVRSQQRADEVVADLRRRGFAAATADGAGVDAVVTAALELDDQPLIAADVPFDSERLAAMDLEDGLVLVEPAELPHLRLIAREAAITLQALGTRPQRASAGIFREEVRRAITERDLDAQIALLGPLFESHSAVEIAAALSAMLREKRAAEPKPETKPAEPGRPVAFVRLFVSAGTRDNIRPGDLVGAITGEAGVKGEQIGKIELRDTFAVVEVAADVADRVIRALNGTTLRGRSLRVDFDRKATSPAARPQRSFRPQRS
jgi:ATP-dependent RNA helicase DeaD